jgi:hypothetical protein
MAGGGKPFRGRKARRKPRAYGEEPHRRPTRRDELAQHSEIVWYARGGKCGGSAVEQRAITWGMVAKRTWRDWLSFPTFPQISLASAPEKSAEVIIVGKMSRGHDARLNNDTGGLNR